MSDDDARFDHTERVRSLLGEQYRIEREIGRGGMAVVYKAIDLQHGRDVALKVLRPELAVAIGARRFLREIEIAARLQHPHIVPLLSSGEVEEVLYFTMPLIEGETLADRLIREKQLPIPEAVHIATEVGRALAYAHEQGIVHRDVKPGNILFSSGHAVVSDFGIAAAITVAGAEQLTSTGLALGTPAYASPEQASGAGDVDGRSDIYSLGCVLYEMLAGEPPFGGRTAQVVLARHMIDPHPSIETARPSVSSNVAAVLDRALAKTPADRFPTAMDVVKALEAADTAPLTRTSGGVPGELPQARATPPRKKRTRRRVLIGAGLVALIAAVSIPIINRARAQVLDPNKVLYFPLAEERLEPDDRGAGYEVALAIEGALAYADPLEIIDGQLWMSESQRSAGQTPTAEVAERISRERGARYFLSGAVRGYRGSDSVTVILRLHDLVTGGAPVQAVKSGTMNRVALVGVDAIKELLPQLVDPGRAIDLTAIEDRDAAAVALWVQGEREYRRSNFDEASDLYERAIAADSALALAAIKGAQAAEWSEGRGADERLLLAAALAHDSFLPDRYSNFAHGLDAYYRGQSDSAIAFVERALAEAPDWAEAQHLIGEVQYHLIPSGMVTDSVAEQYFLAAVRADSSFSPPLYHLAEIAIRAGDVDRADELIKKYRRFSADPLLMRKLELMLACVRGGPTSVEWRRETTDDLIVLRRAGHDLAGGASQPACAEAAFTAFLSDTVTGGRWGVMFQLQGLLAAQGRTEEAIAVVDEALTFGSGAGKWYLLDELAGAPTERKAEDWVDVTVQRWGFDSLLVETHWIVGLWRLARGEVELARRSFELIADSARIEGRRDALLAAASFAGHLTLAEGDTTGAIAAFREVRPTAPRDSLWWRNAEGLPVDRLRLSGLLLATGEYEDAIVVASGFDHRSLASYLPFIPKSLLIRIAAAEALGRSDLVAEYRERLRALGREDLLESIDAGTASPS